MESQDFTHFRKQLDKDCSTAVSGPCLDLQNENFIHDLTKELVRSGKNSYSDRDNYDHLQKPRTSSEILPNENAELKQTLHNAKEHVKNLVRPFYHVYRALGRSVFRWWRKKFSPANYFQPYAERYSGSGYLYSRLKDQTSRAVRNPASFPIKGQI